MKAYGLKLRHWRCSWLCAGILLMGTLPSAEAAGPAENKNRPTPYRVVLLHSFPSIVLSGGEELTPSLVQALREKSKVPLDITAEYSALDRYKGAAYEASLLRLYNEKYGAQKVDLIIAVGQHAMDLLANHRFLEQVPVVTTYSGDLAYLERIRARRPNVVGIYPNETTTRTVELMLSLYPRTKKIHVVFGSSPYDRSDAEKGRVLFQDFAQRVQFEYWNDLSLDQMEAKAKSLPGEDLVLYARVTRDVTGREFTSNEPLQRIAKASSRPLFGVNSNSLGEGIVGGVLVSADLSGKAAAELVLKVLAGEKGTNLPFARDPGFAPIFDWRELQRWGIKEKALPHGSLIRFRKVSLWETYWKEISLGLGIIGLEGVLIAGLVILLRQRRRTERSLAESKLRYRTVADFTYDWEFWCLADGHFEYVSPACERLTGHPPMDFIQDQGLLERLVLEEDRPAWRGYQAMALAGKPQGSIEYRIRDREGEVRWVEQASNPVNTNGDQSAGTRGSIRDITERKKSELEIRALKERLEAENTYYREQVASTEGSSQLIGQSAPMQALHFRIQQVAPLMTTVLIQGETGTGKELVAESLHGLSGRKDHPLIKVNCAALPPGLAESELFGHEKGAFTGAHSQRKGRFELADGGTLFLDEVGELPHDIQAKLLRVLQDGQFERVGGGRTLSVDVRVIAATNRILADEVAHGRFREDLWYRLNVFPVNVPPLRDRKEDLPSLVRAFVTRFTQRLGRPELDIPQAVIHVLQDYRWPGNVRELQNVVERAVIVSAGTSLRLADPLGHGRPNGPGEHDHPQTLESVERAHILHTLERVNWKIAGKQGAAELLGINPSTLRSRMQKLGVERSSD